MILFTSRKMFKRLTSLIVGLFILGLFTQTAFAQSTIGTNISTTGTLSVTSTSTLTDNVTAAADIAINGGDLTTTAATFNLVNAATTFNIGSTSVARTINIGTGNLVDTINIGTDNSGADVIRIGAMTGGESSSDVAISDANWSITTAGVASFDDVNVVGGDIIGAATQNVFNASTTVNLGSTHIARTLNIGTGSEADAINIGTSAAAGALGDTINIGTGAQADTINIGTNNSGVDVIRIGAITGGESSSDVAISDANWSITSAGVGSFDDVNVVGGDITGAATQNVFNASTTVNLGSTHIARTLNIGTGSEADAINIGTGVGAGALGDTINIGTGSQADTINIGTDNSGADVIRIGAITAGESSSDVAISDAQWSITSAGVASFDDVNVGGGTVLSALLHGTVEINPSSVAIGGLCNVTTVAVTGIAVADKVFVSPVSGASVEEGFFFAGALVPTLANTLAVRYCATSAANAAPTATTLSWMAIR